MAGHTDCYFRHLLVSCIFLDKFKKKEEKIKKKKQKYFGSER